MNEPQSTANLIITHLKSIADPKRAEGAKRFFKSGKGEYGEGDQFIGISNPTIHQAVKQFKPVDIEVCSRLLKSQYHEVRFFALCMMIELFKPKKSELKESIIELYLKNTQYINNWDLVDCSAYKLLGEHLVDKDRSILFELANSSSLWERRISIVSNFSFIKRGDFDTTLKLAEILLQDREDLMHKAVGWMLKEIGKRNEPILIDFLGTRFKKMPRTMLRTTIEKLPSDTRKRFLNN